MYTYDAIYPPFRRVRNRRQRGRRHRVLRLHARCRCEVAVNKGEIKLGQPTPGEYAYMAYAAVTDNKNYQGLPMPTWADLTDKIREAWEAAAIVVNDGWFGQFD